MSHKIRIAQPHIDDSDIEYIVDILRRGLLAHGKIVEEFEREFSRYLGVQHVVAVANGTIALELALRAHGVGLGDEVIVPSYTFIATSNTVVFTGAKPVFCDVEWDTFNIDPKCVESKISRRTKAIIPVHLFGHPADMDPILKIAKENNIVVIEDAAQAHGARYRGRVTGSLADSAAFSFYATKNISMGEGGAVATGNSEVAEKIRLYRNHGQKERYIHVKLGGNYRITSIQAALGITQLRKLDELNRRRRKNAEYLNRYLGKLGWIETPVEKDWAYHVYHQYVVKVVSDAPVSRDELYARLREAGVEAMIYYPLPLNMQPVYREMGIHDEKCCPTAMELSKRSLAIPVHPGLSTKDLEYIVEIFEKI